MSAQPTAVSPPLGYAYGPRYRPSWRSVALGVFTIARGTRRSLARDALLALADMPVPPLVRGQDRIPERGGVVLVANHYERPGLWMAWPALLVSHVVRQRTGADTRWVAIEGWDSFSLLGVSISPQILHWVFVRAFHTYGIIGMPPSNAPAAARAAAMRATARDVRAGEIVGIMPEGDVGPTPELLEPREGVGTFLQMLAATGAQVLPVGLYEEGGRLVANFGEPLPLDVPRGVTREESDRSIRLRVMLALRDLLPEPLWGVYRDRE